MVQVNVMNTITTKVHEIMIDITICLQLITVSLARVLSHVLLCLVVVWLDGQKHVIHIHRHFYGFRNISELEHIGVTSFLDFAA